MKKNLIVALALVFVLGIAGTAFAAANPFVDVPAKHWAYDAVTKLAQAGILDGYGDGTYRGERLATRYELAQATAKAMARADKADAQMKALIDKLAVEFAAELNNLGVRVAKLEKNASTIKFTGDARIRYQTNQNAALQISRDTTKTGSDQIGAQNAWNQRIRLNAVADVNDKVQFVGRIAYDSTKGLANGDTNSDSASPAFDWEIGKFVFKYNPTSFLTVGRWDPQMGNGFVYGVSGKTDGIAINFGDPLKVQIGYGDFQGKSSAFFRTADSTQNTTVAGDTTKYATQTNTAPRTAYWADLTYGVNKDWSLFGTAFIATDLKQYPIQLYGLGAQGKLNADFTFKGNYAWNTANEAKVAFGDENKVAWAAQLQFKGADKAKVGSWGLYVNYRDIKPGSLDGGLASGILGNDIGLSTYNGVLYGMKGWGFQADYTISKNDIMTATYLSMNRNKSVDNTGVVGALNGGAADTSAIAGMWYLQANFWF